ncbi:MAG TPA: FG-GAP-like repeat-containing protein [Myxococcales bacterium]|jgi:hypothetical protein
MVRRSILLCASLMACACSDGRTREHTEPDPYCGDGKKNGAEKCDASDLGGETCESLGYLSGTLVCAEDCSFDAIGCSRTCGNAVIDPGETCDGTQLGGIDCAAWGRTSCDGACSLVQSCLDAPLVEAQRQSFRTQPYAHLAPRERDGVRSVELFVVLPGDDRIAIQRFDKDKGFLDDRVIAFEPGALDAAATLVADLSGDGSADVALAGASEVLFKVSGATGFSTKTVPVSCAANPRVARLASGELVLVCSDGAGANWLVPFRYEQGSFTAAGKVELETAFFQSVADVTGDGKADLLVRSAANSIKVLAGDGALGFAFGGKEWAKGQVTGAFTAFDANGDGLLDLLLDGGSLLEQQADGSFLGSTIAGGGIPADLDADGRVDLLAVEPTSLRARRNSGGHDFSRLQELDPALASVAQISLGDAQLDDAPEDVVVSGATAEGQFQVIWYRNQSR